MKVWSTEKLGERVDCVATIREHAGPIFTAVEGEGLLFTGGMEGVVRGWSFPRKLGQGARKLQVGQWNNSEEQKL